MSQSSTIPQELMTGALLHFESGVPICDLNVRKENKERMARVDHVFWQWKKNPFLDVFALFKQLVKGKYSGKVPEWYAAQKDKMLFDFVVEHVAPPSRREDEMKVRFAAERAIQIGADTDNPQALVKGGNLLKEVAHLNQPESDNTDTSKVMFLPPVVTTNVEDVDPSRQNVTDEQALAIINKWGAFVDPKRQAIDDKVALMEARSGAGGKEEDQHD